MRVISRSILPIILVSILIILTYLITLFSGCIEPSPYCPSRVHVDLSGAESFENNDELPFRFPLDNISELQSRTVFAAYGYASSSPSSKEYHAAEDYDQVPGTPVYAMAGGVVSFSGPMGGYGWLVIIDHPNMNLYSLYGHLSPSRWYIESGETVEKGQLIAHLGDADENGGSEENPLTPHLHFGIRAGQRADYPSIGEWRWQAGWIKYCPQDLGWLQPSLIITSQDISQGGFSNPQTGFLEIWWLELILSVAILTGAIFNLVMLTRRSKLTHIFIFSVFLALATWFSFAKEFRISYALITLCVLLLVVEGFKLIKHFRHS